MRLSHWDFRPKQRRKYVAAGSADGRGGRKLPALRILLLAAIGGLVYLKYDAFVQSAALEKLRHPERLWQAVRDRMSSWFPPAVAKAVPAGPADTTGSGRLEWTCASAVRDSCLDAWALPTENARGAVRAALGKALAHTGFPDPTGFSVVFLRVPPEPIPPETESAPPDAGSSPPDAGSWELTRLILAAGDSTVTWASLPDASGTRRWCVPSSANPGLCPEAAAPRPPTRRYATVELRPEHPPVLGLRTALEEAVRPVLPGRILEVPQGPEGWLKVHHGGTLFSYYSGLAKLRPGLVAGLRVDAEDTLGFTGPPPLSLATPPAYTTSSASASSAAATASPVADTVAGAVGGRIPPAPASEGILLLRIEKDGSPADPQAFLGLDPDMAAGPDDVGDTDVR